MTQNLSKRRFVRIFLLRLSSPVGPAIFYFLIIGFLLWENPTPTTRAEIFIDVPGGLFWVLYCFLYFSVFK